MGIPAARVTIRRIAAAAAQLRAMPGIYDDPTAYDLAFAFRDFSRECDFLLDRAARSLGRPATSAAELGAGPARHSRELAARGLRAVAVDANPGAGAYLAAHAPELEFVLADMRQARADPPVDLVYCPLGTFAYLLDDEAMLAALGAAADSLVPRGLLCLELLPIDGHRGSETRWRAGEVEVIAGPSRWLSNDVYEWELRLVRRHAGAVTEQSEVQRQRYLTVPRLQALLRRSERFGEVQAYAEWDSRLRWRDELSYVVCATRR